MSPHPMARLCALLRSNLWAFALLLAACGGSTANDEALLLNADDPLLKFAALDERGVWSSAPFQDSRWIPFGPGAEVQIEHGLGRVPAWALSYISYTEDDRKDTDPRVFSAAAGDVANVLEVNDSYITFKNRTRGKFFMRVALQ